ncbi:hypothetical protein MAP00_005538 [Monascus purpureus]|nr:hypothetical protein MAP00_005538 [Monascus purpureus]
MTGGKRPSDDPDSSSRETMRLVVDDSEHESQSSSLPASPQLETSNISHKIPDEISIDVRYKWREFAAPDGFFAFAGCDLELYSRSMAQVEERRSGAAVDGLRKICRWLGRQMESIRWAS